jgi:hypothetical protein
VQLCYTDPHHPLEISIAAVTPSVVPGMPTILRAARCDAAGRVAGVDFYRGKQIVFVTSEPPRIAIIAVRGDVGADSLAAYNDDDDDDSDDEDAGDGVPVELAAVTLGPGQTLSDATPVAPGQPVRSCTLPPGPVALAASGPRGVACVVCGLDRAVVLDLEEEEDTDDEDDDDDDDEGEVDDDDDDDDDDGQNGGAGESSSAAMGDDP